MAEFEKELLNKLDDIVNGLHDIKDVLKPKNAERRFTVGTEEVDVIDSGIDSETKELLKKLEHCSGVRKMEVGLYRRFELVEKYTRRGSADAPVLNGVVLFIETPSKNSKPQ